MWIRRSVKKVDNVDQIEPCPRGLCINEMRNMLFTNGAVLGMQVIGDISQFIATFRDKGGSKGKRRADTRCSSGVASSLIGNVGFDFAKADRAAPLVEGKHLP